MKGIFNSGTFTIGMKVNIIDILILYHNFGQYILQEKFDIRGI